VIRVTLDSNIYVPALQFGGIGVRLVGMARFGAIRMDTSEAILAETIGVLRDKFEWDGYRLHFARLELRKFAHLVVPSQTLDVTGDPDDNHILRVLSGGWLRLHRDLRPRPFAPGRVRRDQDRYSGRLPATRDGALTDTGSKSMPRRFVFHRAMRAACGRRGRNISKPLSGRAAATGQGPSKRRRTG
jgi:hypothetical protein